MPISVYLIGLAVVSVFAFGMAIDAVERHGGGLSVIVAILCGAQWALIAIFVAARYLWGVAAYIAG